MGDGSPRPGRHAWHVGPKRFGGAIGEGAAVVPQLHSFLVDGPVALQCGPQESETRRVALSSAVR